jgi:endonuclease/exonuclease/phosphatase (EEP) superfamily protein YafD
MTEGALPAASTPTRSREALIASALLASFVLARLSPLPASPEGPIRGAVFAVLIVLQSLSWHLACGAAALGALAASRRRWPCALLHAGPALWLITIGVSSTQGSRAEEAPREASLGLISVNLYMANATPRTMLEQLLSARADVIALQEYNAGWHALLAPALATSHPYALYQLREDAFGMALYSRLPFLPIAEMSAPRFGRLAVPAQRVSVSLGGRRIDLLNIHTLPPRRVSYVQEQWHQFVGLRAACAARTAPMIICGDFNWGAYSSYHASLGAIGFRDGYEAVGAWSGATWPSLGLARWAPGLRLDHVYASPEIRFVNHRVGAPAGSDHRPLIARLALASAEDSAPAPERR